MLYMESSFLKLFSFLIKFPSSKPEPTELFFFLQQNKAECRVSQDQLSRCGQAHDAASHHGHIICTKRQKRGFNSQFGLRCNIKISRGRERKNVIIRVSGSMSNWSCKSVGTTNRPLNIDTVWQSTDFSQVQTELNQSNSPINLFSSESCVRGGVTV